MGDYLKTKSSTQRKVYITLYALVLCLIFLPSVISVQISDSKFTWMDEEIEYVSPGKPIPTYFLFTYSLNEGETVSSIKMDATDMQSAIQFKQYYDNIDVTGCTQNVNGAFDCKVKTSEPVPPPLGSSQLALSVSDAEVKIILKFTMADGTVQEKEISKTFTIDNTKPKITDITSDNCYTSEKKCYVASLKPNKITIKMQDEQASFARKRVAFKVGDKLSYVSDCSDLTCYGYVAPRCQTPRNLPVSIASYGGMPSQDDAGNEIIQDKAFSVVCDPDAPELVEGSKSIISSVSQGAAPLNEEFIVQLEVIEKTSPSVTMTVVGESLDTNNVTAICIRQEDKFICNVAITAATPDAGDYTLPLIIKDLAGNTLKESIDVRLLDVNEKPTPLWSVESVKQSSDSFLKSNLAFERSIFTEVELKGRSDARLVSAKSSKPCVPKVEDESGFPGDIADVNILYMDNSEVGKAKIIIKLALREGGKPSRYDDLSELKYTCPLDLVSVRGFSYYTKPEEENFTISFELKEGPNFYRNLEGEIKSVQNSVQAKMEIIRTYQQSVGIAQTICRVCGYVEKTSVALSSASAIMHTNPFTEVAAPETGLLGDSIGVTGNTGICGSDKVRPVCEFMTCKADYQKYFLKFLETETLNDIATFGGGYNNFTTTLNPYKSFIVATATMCLPAVSYHYRVYTGIQCNYLRCLTEGVGGYGATVASCQEEKATSECAYFTGAVLDAIPVVSLVRESAARLGEMIKDPLQMIGFATPYLCSLTTGSSGSLPQATCNVVNNAISAMNVLSTLNNIFTPEGDPSSNCQDVMQWYDLDPNDWRKIGNHPVELQYQTDATINGKKIICTNDRCRVDGTNTYFTPVRNDKGNAADVLIFDNNKLSLNRDSLYESYEDYRTQSQGALKLRADLLEQQREIYMQDPAFVKKQITVDGKLVEQSNNPHVQNIDKQLAQTSTELNNIQADFDYDKDKTWDIVGDLKNHQKTHDPAMKGLSSDLTKEGNEAALSSYLRANYNGLDYNKLTGEQKQNVVTHLNEVIKINAQYGEEVGKLTDARKALGDSYEFGKNVGMISQDGTYLGDDTLIQMVAHSLEHSDEYYDKLTRNPDGSRNQDLVDAVNEVKKADEELSGWWSENANRMLDEEKKIDSQKTLDALKGSTNLGSEDLRSLLRGMFGYETIETPKYGGDIGEFVEKSVLDEPINDFVNSYINWKSDPENFGNDFDDFLDDEKDMGSWLEKTMLENNKNLETLKNELDGLVDDKEEQYSDLHSEETSQQLFGNMRALIRQAWGNAQAISSFRKLFKTDWFTWSDNSFIGEVGNAVHSVSQAELTMCSASKEDLAKAGTGDGVILNVVGGASYRSGAYVNGRKSQQIENYQTGEKYYEYWISGSVATFKDYGLKYKVMMMKDNGQMVDFTKKVMNVDEILVNQNAATPFGVGAGNQFKDTESYKKVCIQFQTANLNKYFDYVSIDGNRLCQNLITE